MFDKEYDICSLQSIPDALCKASDFICGVSRPEFPNFGVDMFN